MGIHSENINEAVIAAEKLAEDLLELVRQITIEMHPRRQRTISVSLDSSLDKELGFDSLSRTELLLRIERVFDVDLPEQLLLAIVETPRDLLQAILDARGEKRIKRSTEVKPIHLDKEMATPDQAKTLIDVLEWHYRVHAQRPHIYLYGEDDKPDKITYAQLYQGAHAVAAGLRGRDLVPGQTVAVMLPTSRGYFYSFLGILLAGCIPVPIYPPARLTQIEDHLNRHAGILNNAWAVELITIAEAKPVSRLLKTQVERLRAVITIDELLSSSSGASVSMGIARAEDVAFIQYTSGSTGNPKGVVLTHANLLANIRAMGEATQVDSTDVFVSWLPLYHDMGLIGAWLGSFYYALPLVVMSPLIFLVHPERWLWAIHRHRGTLTAAPNFAYELCLRKIEDNDIEGLDLSSLRMMFNGAEPVSAITIQRFSERFAKHGFKPEAMAPVYGLAESTVGLAFPPVGRGPLIDRIQRSPFEQSGQAIPAEEGDSTALQFVACGQPLPRHQIRIVDAAGRELPERQEGRVEFKGPSTTSGYFRNKEETQHLFDGEWLDSADLAYMAGGDVYLTSRIKDVIIRAGRNIYPYEAEEALGDIPGIRKGCIAIFSTTDPVLGTERLIVLAESHETQAEILEQLHTQVDVVATDILGVAPDDILVVPPRTVLKTSSGKIRRAACRELYERGLIGKQQRAVWWQFMRLWLVGVGPQLRRSRRMISDTLYAVYVWALFWLMAPSTWLLVVLFPFPRWIWFIMRKATRLLARLTRIPLSLHGLDKLPLDSPCIMVSNHSSYLDGIILVGTLPMQFSFVAKAELAASFISRLFLNRLGAEYVERFDMQQGVIDARRVEQRVRMGRSLVFFPEGTFVRMPGLLPFHMGAFVAAAEAGVPVVPITIRGTRSILRESSMFPRRGRISVTIGAPIQPESTEWSAAVKLRNAVRSEILRDLGEPDLSHDI